MRILLKILAVLVVVVVAGGAVAFAFWEIPAPRTPVEKVLPDARFPH